MTNEDTIETLEEMWELLFKEMRSRVFKELKSTGEIDRFKKALDTAVSALKVESCEDAIDRQALRAQFNHLDEVYEGMSEEEEHEAYIYGQIIRAIDDAPPVTPQQRTGRWIKRNTYYECSLCACFAPSVEVLDGILWKPSNFCPDCGARMEGAQE